MVATFVIVFEEILRRLVHYFLWNNHLFNFTKTIIRLESVNVKQLLDNSWYYP